MFFLTMMKRFLGSVGVAGGAVYVWLYSKLISNLLLVMTVVLLTKKNEIPSLVSHLNIIFVRLSEFTKLKVFFFW